MDTKKTDVVTPLFLSVPDSARRELVVNVSRLSGLNVVAVEKDWWITAILQCVFSLKYADAIQFKGGTNLSKCWSLIERMSEDIDLAIDREYLGFNGELSKSQVSNRLQRASKAFIIGQFLNDLKESIIQHGIPLEVLSITTNDNGIPTLDPVQIHIRYPSLFEEDNYLLPQVMLEVSGRSSNVALSQRSITSFVDKYIPNKEYAMPEFEVTAVQPKRTFIEKVCLLHEEFNKSHGEIRSKRMSRHLYDLFMMCNQGIDKQVMADEELFKGIIRHRFIYNRVDGVDYNTETPGHFAIILTGDSLRQWELDYRNTIEKMIYGEMRPSFHAIIERIKTLNEDLNGMEWKETPVFKPGQ